MMPPSPIARSLARFSAAVAAIALAMVLAAAGLGGCAAPPSGGAASQNVPRSVPPSAAVAGDWLPSWRDGPARQAIVKFVAAVTQVGSPDFVPPQDRVAVFDNDGTLWGEQPLYTQYFFLFEQIKAAAPQHPEWANNPAYQAVAANDMTALAEHEMELAPLLLAANSGMSVEDYDKTIRAWLATARHPKFNRPFTELVYQPQLELLSYLRANGFRIYIVSGGSIEFMRTWTEQVYGIPPENVIGSSQALRYVVHDGKPVLVREPRMDFVDVGPGKPIGIYRQIGRRPILAVGNSDGDLQMLEYTTGGAGPRLGMLVHHDDAEREFAYDRQSKVGKLDKALDAAESRGWVVISMRQDWDRIYPDSKKR